MLHILANIKYHSDYPHVKNVNTTNKTNATIHYTLHTCKCSMLT